VRLARQRRSITEPWAASPKLRFPSTDSLISTAAPRRLHSSFLAARNLVPIGQYGKSSRNTTVRRVDSDPVREIRCRSLSLRVVQAATTISPSRTASSMVSGKARSA
jgi:hypothetical protein